MQSRIPVVTMVLRNPPGSAASGNTLAYTASYPKSQPAFAMVFIRADRSDGATRTPARTAIPSRTNPDYGLG